MKLRRLRPEEEDLFLELEREAIYPGLSQEEMEKWIEGEGVYAPLIFVLERENKIIGGLVLEIQDCLGEKEVLLQLDALFVLPGYRRQGLGKALLLSGLLQAYRFYRENGLETVGLLIQTTGSNEGAVDFYRHFCCLTPFSCQEVVQKMGKEEVIVFLISFL